MALVARNNETGLKTEYASWEQSAYQILNGKKVTRPMKRMMNIQYLGNGLGTHYEVYGRIEDIRVESLKQSTSIPKLDCSGILPADATLLQMFQATCGSEPRKERSTQRFVLKPRWYRIFNSEGEFCNSEGEPLFNSKGELLKYDPVSLREVIRPGTRIDIEYHMNYMRVVGMKKEVPCGDPIVRKITILELVGTESS